MIITCSNCTASFSVPDEVIPDVGRNVKCSKCANIWYVQKQNNQSQIIPQESPEIVTEVKTSSDSTMSEQAENLPAIQEPENNLQWIFSSFGLLLAILFSTFILYFNILTSYEKGAEIAAKIGFSDTKNFAIQDIRIRTAKYSGKYAILLKYRIYNNSDQIRQTPWVRMQFFDNDNKLFYTHIGTNSRFKFQGFQIVPTKAEFKDLTREVSRIEIALGNKIELYTR